MRRAEEHAAIYDYVSSSYGMNRQLRDGRELDERSRVVKTGLDSWLTDAKRTNGIYFRGIAWNADTEWSSAQKGDVITDKAFGSFTSSKTQGMKFGSGKSDKPGIVIVARGSLAQLPYHIKGRYGQTLGESVRGEREFLAARNTQFKILRTQDITLRYSRKRGVDELVRDPNGEIIKKQRIVYVDIVDPRRADASPESVARLAKRRRQPFGTPLARYL
jgi:hypothetical protein